MKTPPEPYRNTIFHPRGIPFGGNRRETHAFAIFRPAARREQRAPELARNEEAREPRPARVRGDGNRRRAARGAAREPSVDPRGAGGRAARVQTFHAYLPGYCVGRARVRAVLAASGLRGAAAASAVFDASAYAGRRRRAAVAAVPEEGCERPPPGASVRVRLHGRRHGHRRNRPSASDTRGRAAAVPY